MAKKKKKRQPAPKVDMAKVYKAFAIASTIGAIIQTGNNGNPKLQAMMLQCNRAMRVFNAKIGRDKYWEISKAVNWVWEEINQYHDTTVTVDEIPIVVEMVYGLMPRPLMREFLNFDFSANGKIREENKSSLLSMVMSIDELFNKAFGTKQTATREQIGSVMCKPVTAYRKKAPKEKPKKITKAQKRHKEQVEADRKRKAQRKAFLASIRERAARLKAEKQRERSA